MEMVGWVLATLFGDVIVGEQVVGVVSAGTMRPVNEAALPALAGREGQGRVTNPPRGYHMAVPPSTVQLRQGWTPGPGPTRGLPAMPDQADRLGRLLALGAR